MADIFGVEVCGLSEEETADRLVEAILAWIERIDLPTKLSGHGIGAETIPKLVESISMARARGVFGEDFSHDDARAIYEQCL